MAEHGSPALESVWKEKEPTVLLDVDDTGVAVITLKRGKYNQFTEEQTAKLNAVLKHCAESRQVRVDPAQSLRKT